MSHRWYALLLGFVALLLTSQAWAAPYRPPPIAGHVTDAAQKLTPAQVASLDEKLADYRKCSGNHVAVFLAASLEGNTIEDVAYETFNTWKIGEAKKDSGVLLVLAPNERKVRIETGKGVGGSLTDIQSKDILREKVSPRMKADDFFGAADQGTTAIGAALGGCTMHAVVTPPDAQAPPPPRPPLVDPGPPKVYPSYWLARIAMGLGLALLLGSAVFALRKDRRAALGGAAFTMFASQILFSFLGGMGDKFDIGAVLDLFTLLAAILFFGNIIVWVMRIRGTLPGSDATGSYGGESSSGDSYGSSFGSSSSSSFDSSSSFGSSSSSSSSSSSDNSYSGGGGSSGGGGASDSY
jgi:uncharacterized protein